ncbi:MAG: class I SAM-dependent RNA methyltransferase [Acidobacteriia bacterium]|nr:class I SAM-dependent RNA methyltransferase [Terriglobia bacterium]
MNPPIELTIDKLVHGGYGLAFKGERAYFILNALPGESIRAEIIREKKNTSFGKTVEILHPSPLRIEAPCPHFMHCGGCHLQHLEYTEQLRFKRAILEETFLRIGQIKLADVEVIASPPWHYRTRAQFKVMKRPGNVQVGFFAVQSHRLWAIDQCPLLADRLNELLRGIQAEREGFLKPDITAEEFQVRTSGDESQWAMDFVGQPPEFEFAEESATMVPDGNLNYQTQHGNFRVGSNSFFQVNRFLLEPLVSKSIEGASGSKALDLFSGVGLFTVPLSRDFEQVVAIEENPYAVSDLQENLRANGCANVQVLGSDVSVIHRWGPKDWEDVDFVVFDPPRQGVERGVLGQFVKHQVPACVYVSCDPTSMARDLKILCAGGYQITSTQLFDFFPQTYHFETLIRLRRPISS